MILVFISRRSLRSRWVLNELDAAMIREITERRMITIPVLLGRLDEARLPSDLSGKKWVDLRHNFAAKYKQYRQDLVNSLKLAAYTDNGVQADNWIPVGDELILFFVNYRFSSDETTLTGADDVLTICN